jgi:hypothetical protein
MIEVNFSKEWSEEKNSFVFKVNSEGIEPRQMANIIESIKAYWDSISVGDNYTAVFDGSELKIKTAIVAM